MPDYRMETLEDRVSVKVVKNKASETNKEGGCHIGGVYRKPGSTVNDVPLGTARALAEAGYVEIGKVQKPAKNRDTQAER